MVTHRTDDAPDPDTGFHFVDGLEEALAAGHNDQLGISTAPVVLGAGKRLFAGFTQDIELEILQVHSSAFATHVRYAVRR